MHSKRNHLAAGFVAAALVALAALAWLPRGEAQSATPDEEGVAQLLDKTVYVFFLEQPGTGPKDVIQLHGKVKTVDEHGFWLRSTHRYFKQAKHEEEYESFSYVPWTAVGYVRIGEERPKHKRR